MVEPRRILLIKPSSLGDIVHALPVLAALRAAYPQAYIAWLIGSGFADVLHDHPLIDELIPFDRKRFGRIWRSPRVAWEFLQFVRAIRRRRFDLVLDLQGLIRSGLVAWFSGARRTLGFADSRELAWIFYSQRVRASAGHAVERNLQLARAAGLSVVEPDFPLGLRATERLAARRRIEAEFGRAPGMIVAVAPGARWDSKRWNVPALVETLTALTADPERAVLLLGGPDERALTEEILAQVKPVATAPINLVGKTRLREMVAMLAVADQVLCCDSGPMHIAAALGKPTVALFGPTDPARTGPYSAAARVLRVALPCSPCLRRTCPLGHHRCMQELRAAEAVQALRELPAGSAEPAQPTAQLKPLSIPSDPIRADQR